MILETRSVILSDDELYMAVQPILKERGFDTDTPVASVNASFDDASEVVVTVKTSDEAEPIVIETGELGPAVLNHCINNGIPLPRGSYKELTLRGDHIALIVRLETDPSQSEVNEEDE